jgi:hypothetical protein
VLGGKKKFLTQIAEWIDGANKESANTWTFNKETVIVSTARTAFELWSIWRLSGHWPLGNWLEQPLSLLVQIEAIDTVYHTWREFRHNDSKADRPRGLASMNGTQLAIVRDFEGAADG